MRAHTYKHVDTSTGEGGHVCNAGFEANDFSQLVGERDETSRVDTGELESKASTAEPQTQRPKNSQSACAVFAPRPYSGGEAGCLYQEQQLSRLLLVKDKEQKT